MMSIAQFEELERHFGAHKLEKNPSPVVTIVLYSIGVALFIADLLI